MVHPSTHPSRNSLVVETRSAEETKRLALTLAPVLVPGDVVVLAGDLGAGKTTFVQGLAAGLGIVERVTSPSFILMKEYLGGRFPLMHLDIYRLEKVQEVIDLGYDEFLDPSYVVAVEWGDMVEALLPKEHLKVVIRHNGGDARTITLTGKGDRWAGRIQTVRLLAQDLFIAARSMDQGTFSEHFQPGRPEASGRN